MKILKIMRLVEDSWTLTLAIFKQKGKYMAIHTEIGKYGNKQDYYEVNSKTVEQTEYYFTQGWRERPVYEYL